MSRGNLDRRQAMDYELARLPREVTTAITWYMEDHGVSRSQLAQRLGVTPGRVSQILSGDDNLTLRTVAAVCVALDARLDAELVPDDGRHDRAVDDAGPLRSSGSGHRGEEDSGHERASTRRGGARLRRVLTGGKV